MINRRALFAGMFAAAVIAPSAAEAIRAIPARRQRSPKEILDKLLKNSRYGKMAYGPLPPVIITSQSEFVKHFGAPSRQRQMYEDAVVIHRLHHAPSRRRFFV